MQETGVEHKGTSAGGRGEGKRKHTPELAVWTVYTTGHVTLIWATARSQIWYSSVPVVLCGQNLRPTGGAVLKRGGRRLSGAGFWELPGLFSLCRPLRVGFERLEKSPHGHPTSPW